MIIIHIKATGRPRICPERVIARWSLDIVHVQFACGRRLRVLNLVYDVTRECLTEIPDTSIPGRCVVRELSALIGTPRQTQDNCQQQRAGTDVERDPEVVRCAQRRMALRRAGKPMQNGFVESFTAE
jgi:putative transposase